MKYMYMSFCLLPFLESLIGPCIGLQFFNQFDNQSNWDRLDSSVLRWVQNRDQGIPKHAFPTDITKKDKTFFCRAIVNGTFVVGTTNGVNCNILWNKTVICHPNFEWLFGDKNKFMWMPKAKSERSTDYSKIDSLTENRANVAKDARLNICRENDTSSYGYVQPNTDRCGTGSNNYEVLTVLTASPNETFTSTRCEAYSNNTVHIAEIERRHNEEFKYDQTHKNGIVDKTKEDLCTT